MYDVFLHKNTDGSILIECDHRVTEDFLMHLRQYKLRSNIQLENHSDQWRVLTRWGGPALSEAMDLLEGASWFVDPRCDWQMQRAITHRALVDVAMPEANSNSYSIWRMIKGVPEGPSEMQRAKAIPMEFNLDFAHASKH